MSILIREDKGNSILIQAGNGVPTHLSTIGSLFVDKNTGAAYINKNNLAYWAELYDTETPLIHVSGVSATTLTALTINTDQINFNTTPTLHNVTGGTLFFDSTTNSLSYKPITSNNDVTVNLGFEELIAIYNGTGVQINNGQVVNITGSTSGYPSVCLAIASDAANVNFQVDGVATHDIPAGTVGFVTYFGAVHDLNLTGFNNGDVVYLSQTVAGGLSTFSGLSFTGRTCEVGHVVNNSVNGTLQVSISNESRISSITAQEANILNANNTSTGVFDFSGITKTSNTTFSIAPAKGWIVDNVTNPVNPTLKYIEYTGATNIDSPFRTTNTITYILLTSASTLTLQSSVPTPQQRRQNIYLGKIGHPDKANFSIAFQVTDYALSPTSQLRDMFIPIPLINDGITIGANTGLTITNSAGNLYGLGISFPTNPLSPNLNFIAKQLPITFQYRTQTGGTLTATTLIDPGYYDNAGIRTVIGSPAKQSTNQRIFLLQDGSFRLQYGQTVYADLATAIAAVNNEPFVTFSNFRDNGILIGILSVVSNATNLTDSNEAKFFNVSKFGEVFGGGGGGTSSIPTFQQVYNNSSQPEITTNSTLDGLTIKRGSASDSDDLINFQNGASTQVASINAQGLGKFTTLSATTISATTFYGDGSNLTGLVSGNLYNSDGILTGNRLVNTSAYTLSFSSATNPNMLIFSGDSLLIGGTTKDSSALVNFQSTSKGLLIPRMTTVDRNSIAGAGTGLIIYNTDTNALNIYYSGTWNSVGAPTATKVITKVWDGQGIFVTTGNTRYYVMQEAGTITGWNILGIGTSPTCTIDIWKITSGTSLPTVTNTIMGTKPALSTGNVIRSSTMTGWSTLSLNAGDIIGFNIDSISNATVLNFTLEYI